MSPNPTLEARTQEIGRDLLARVAQRRPSALTAAGLEERMMGVMMHDPGLRAALLHFIDVFPSLKTSTQVRDHLAAHLDEISESDAARSFASRFVQWGAKITSGSLAPAFIANGLSRWAVAHMARRFIVEQDAAQNLLALEREGLMFTLDVLGEAVHSHAEADRHLARYLDLIQNLAARLGQRPYSEQRPPAVDLCGPRINLSLKLSALCPHFDPTAPDHTMNEVAARLRPLLRAARESGVFLNVDMEQYELRDLTWHIFRSVLSEPEFAHVENVGLVVQAYLRDAPDQLDEILAWLRERKRCITIRLVKGAYWDTEQIWARQRGWPIPVLLNKDETDAQAERMTATLLENHAIVRTALGSHNARTVARGLALVAALEVPPGDFECQVLHGMGDTLRQALVSMNVPVRVYVPWGELIPGMSYLVRRLLENTSNESFLRHLDEDQPDLLLQDPSS